MLKRVAAVQKLWSSESFQKPRKVIFSSILAQGPPLRKLASDPSEALARMERLAKTEPEKWMVEHLKNNPSDAFEGILAYALVCGGSEEAILGEDLSIPTKENIDMEMARFALVVGNAWEEALETDPEWNSSVRTRFRDPLNPLSLLFSIQGDSDKRMGHLVTQAVQADAFIEELRGGKISELGLEVLRENYGLPVKSASIVDRATVMMKIEGRLDGRGIGMRAVIAACEKRIEQLLEQITKRLAVGFNDLFGKNM